LKHAVQVTILGQQYTVKSAASPEEVQRVADFVNCQVAEVTASKSVDTLNSAILTLMNIGGAYLRLQDTVAERQQVEGRLQELLQRLEQACPDEGHS
jgi:cell division protein ZapA